MGFQRIVLNRIVMEFGKRVAIAAYRDIVLIDKETIYERNGNWILETGHPVPAPGVFVGYRFKGIDGNYFVQKDNKMFVEDSATNKLVLVTD